MGVVNRIGQVLVETYRIERLIAEGGMGSVYEAKHLRLPKRFAVKFLNLSLIDNQEAQARFRREAEIIAALDHPNIVNLLDYNVTDEGVPFIVLEFLDGEHLGRRINRSKLTLQEALHVMAPVVNALAAAHARDIVHRDLKPENIVLCKDDVVKVVDFGIAKIRDGQELTGMNTILGTIPYMAPEQLFGTQVSVRTDQFALGTIVYEMLTAEMAFGGPASVPEVAARVAHHQPPDIKGVPQAVSAVIFQAMAKDAEARFPSVKDFLHALQEAATKPDEPAVIVEGVGALDEGLPELQGEATTITSIVPGPPVEDNRRSLGDETGAPLMPEQGSAEVPAINTTAVIDRGAVLPPPHSSPLSLAHSATQSAITSPSVAAAARASAPDPGGASVVAAGAEQLFEKETMERPAMGHRSTMQVDRGLVTPVPEYTARVASPLERGSGHNAPTVLSPTISDQLPTRGADETIPVSSHASETTNNMVLVETPSRVLRLAIGVALALLLAGAVWFVFLRRH